MKRMMMFWAGIVALHVLAMPSLLCGAEYSLADLYQMALKNSEKIKISEENVNIAKLDISKARGVLIPNISAYGTYTQYTESKKGDTGNIIQPNQAGAWGVQLVQSYSLSGRDLTVMDIAGKTLERSRYDLASLQQDYLLSVAASFYDLLRARQAVEIANANLDRLTKYRDAANTRLRVGEVTRTALLRAEGELSGAQSDKIKAANALEAAKIILARLVGLDGPFDVKETAEIAYTPGSLTDLERDALVRRQDLKSLETQKNIAEKQLTYSRGAYWPSLSVGAAYARIDQTPPNSNMNRDSLYGNVALNFTFYDGGERNADIMQAATRLRQAELLYRDAVNSVTLQVRNAFLDYTTQQGVIRFLQDQLTYARDNFNAVSKQYEFGLSNSLDVIDANNLLLSSQRQLADAQNSSRFSRLNLIKATGALLGETYADKQ